jgi:hypothetical protein
MNNQSSNLITKKNSRFFLFLVFGWIACIVLPHFQKKFDLSTSLAQILIALIMLRSIYFILNEQRAFQKFSNSRIFLMFPLFYVVAVSLNSLGFKELYVLLNRFGAGTMLINDKVFLFGDLAHLTSASDCLAPIKIGEVICDPFSRPLNQNPHIIELLRFISFSNTLLLGLISTVLFFSLAILLSKKNQINPISLFIILLSPPIVLAIDRGNEIITILLVTTSLYLLVRGNMQQTIGAILLIMSCFLKLWPVILVGFLLIFLRKHIYIFAKGIMLIPIIYWVLYFENALKMVSYTDKGSSLGLSFGIKHYLNSSIPYAHIVIYLLTTLLIFVFYFFRVRNLVPVSKEFSPDLAIFVSLSLTYIAIWAMGTSYVYRLIIFIPLIIYLNRAFVLNKSRFLLEALLIVTLLTSRLSITTVLTNSIAVIFCLIIIINLIKRFNLIS